MQHPSPYNYVLPGQSENSFSMVWLMHFNHPAYGHTPKTLAKHFKPAVIIHPDGTFRIFDQKKFDKILENLKNDFRPKPFLELICSIFT